MPRKSASRKNAAKKALKMHTVIMEGTSKINKREKDRRRRERIKNDPELYRQFRDSERARYQRRKQEKKVVPIGELPPEKQKIIRQKNREAFRSYYYRKLKGLKIRAKTGLMPKKLSTLCKSVIEKYKLQKAKKRITEPTTCTIVGGKPLRQRKEASTESPSNKKERKDVKPKHNLTEKVAKKRGRPPKVEKLEQEPKIKRGRPRKETIPEMSVFIADIHPEPEVRIKQELDGEMDDQDPFAPDDEGYTVIVKEELEIDEEIIRAVPPAVTSSSQIKDVLPNLTCSQNAGPSSSSIAPAKSSGPPLMTVVGDEMQIFANSIAEQLRTFPLDRALLLQLEIQTMIDNERQLLLH